MSVGSRATIENVEQLLVIYRGKALHLDPDLPSTHQVQHLGQERQRLTIPNADLPSLRQRELGDGAVSRNVGVMVDHDSPVPSRVDVQLHAIGIERDGAPESSSGVFVFVS